MQWAKITIFNLYMRKYLANGINNMAAVTVNINRKSHIVD